MSGGGTYGAFEAGALWGMFYAANDSKKFEYDVITGVSAGSVNLGAMALFEKEDVENMIHILSD
jgi:predicted acylesterase/phospholipase RssA